MKKIVKSALMVIVLIITLQLHVKAQDDPGDPNGDPEVPIDPGSWVLVAAGVGYGAKKWWDAKQKTTKNGGSEAAGFIENENQVNP